MTAQTKTHIEPTHAGAGTGVALIQLGAIIPGLLPTLALAGLLGVVILLPILVLGLLVGALAAPPYLLWRLARRRASPRQARAQGFVIGPTSGPRRVTPDSAT